MKRGGGVHTVLLAERDRWCNKVDGQVLSRHRRKVDAVTTGREIARRLAVEHTIHREDGQLSEKNSYGNDPFPPQDGK